jgi:hypothetical protein
LVESAARIHRLLDEHVPLGQRRRLEAFSSPDLIDELVDFRRGEGWIGTCLRIRL